jgi:hypothetical protein
VVHGKGEHSGLGYRTRPISVRRIDEGDQHPHEYRLSAISLVAVIKIVKIIDRLNKQVMIDFIPRSLILASPMLSGPADDQTWITLFNST